MLSISRTVRSLTLGLMTALPAAAVALCAMPSGASAADCPNAALRTGAASQLADCRAYELVSPAAKDSTSVTENAVTDDGDRVGMRGEALADTPAESTIFTPYVASRTASGWSTAPASLPPEYNFTGGGGAVDQNATLSSFLWGAATQSQSSLGQNAFYRKDVGGGVNPLTPVLVPGPNAGSWSHFEYNGGSADFSHIVFQNSTTLLPGDPSTTSYGHTNWWEAVSNPAGPTTVRLLQRGNDGQAIGGACGAELGSSIGVSSGRGASHAVSADGSSIYFSAVSGTDTASCAPTSGMRVYQRIDGTQTVAVSASECARPGGCDETDGDDVYTSASVSGTRVFFTSPRQLTDSDTDVGGNDLYLYDASPPPGQPNLVQVSAGDATAGHPTVGSDAQVLGVVLASDDGSRVYFVARGRLTPDATDGAPNLYVYERDAGHPAGRLALVATVSEADAANLWSASGGFRYAQTAPREGTDDAGTAVGGDGHVLVFQTYESLLPSDTDSAADMYRFDDQATTPDQRLQLVSGGSEDLDASSQFTGLQLSSPVYAETHRTVSEDGRTIVFSTSEALVAADVNDAPDVYEWHDGAISLISDGTNPSGVIDAQMSASGDDIVFDTTSRLVPQDTDGAGDIYDARVDGGFPAAPAPPPPCSGDTCQGSAAPSPFIASPAGAPAPSPGTVTAPAPVFSVQAITAKQRSALAKTGKVTLTVTVSDAGALAAKATATLKKKKATVASATTRLTGPASAHLALTLSKKARAALTSTGTLRVTVAVSYSKSATVRRTTLKLTHAEPKKHKAKKRTARTHVKTTNGGKA